MCADLREEGAEEDHVAPVALGVVVLKDGRDLLLPEKDSRRRSLYGTKEFRSILKCGCLNRMPGVALNLNKEFSLDLSYNCSAVLHINLSSC